MKQARKGIDRRAFLAQCAGAAALSGVASRAFADDPLDALMDDGRAGQFGQDFDQASRTIHMPKPTAPMLSPATEEFTQKAIAAYDEIVARGGWPTVPHVDELRVGNRHPSVVDLRQRLSLSGDLDPNAVGAANDIYDSYVEAAIRRFQARHGVTVDGVLRASTLAALNVPAAIRRDQLKVNIARLKTLTTNLGPRYVVVNIPAARVEAIENDVAVSRSEEHTSELQSHVNLVCRLLLEKTKRNLIQAVLDAIYKKWDWDERVCVLGEDVGLKVCVFKATEVLYFFFNVTATTEIYTLSLHDALPICLGHRPCPVDAYRRPRDHARRPGPHRMIRSEEHTSELQSHVISYAVFCLK